MRFAEKVVVVTGGTAGIGRAVVDAFAQEGAIVAVNGRTVEGVSQVVHEVETGGGRAFPIPGDISDEGITASLIRHVIATWGRIDILINNAGILSGAPSEHYTALNKMLAVNVVAPFNLARVAAAESMIANRQGVIINVASIAGFGAIRDDVGYVVTKHALIGLTRSLSLDWAQYGIRVNAIAPGVTLSTMNARFSVDRPDQYAELCRNIPMGRVADAMEQARAVLFLASDDASYITGETLNVDGGLINVI